MHDESHRVPGLSISSMQGGNTVADDAALAQTAPGSTSALPVPDVLDVLPQPTPREHGRTTLLTDGGEHAASAPRTDPATRPGESGHGWHQV